LSSMYSKKQSQKRRKGSEDYRELILRYLGRRSTRPLLARELTSALRIPKEERRKFSRILSSLVQTGDIIRIKGQRYALPSKIQLITGKLKINTEGVGILIPDDGSRRIAISPARMKGAMDGDRIVVRHERHYFRGKPSGSVVRIVERVHKELVALFDVQDGISFGRPYDRAIRRDVIIPPGCEMGAQPGHMTVVRLTEYPTQSSPGRGEVVEILGSSEDQQTETMAVIHTHNLPHRFPKAAISEASSLSDPALKGPGKTREDLRDLLFVTIDGASARDFDDALFAEKGSNDEIKLYVSIADVSHFVKPDTALDREARRRGNSVYFPDMVIPMLPERLSNDLCSLNPDVDRLTFTCEVTVDSKGNPGARRIYPSLIRSKSRLTYVEVEEYLSGKTSGISGKGIEANLQNLRELFARLSERRTGRGSLDFDFPEPEVSLDARGHIENIYRAPRYSSHRLVEECMLLANEVIAAKIRESDVSGVYRVHEPPDEDKIAELGELLSAMGYHLGPAARRSSAPFQEILRSVRGTAKERFLNTVILRSMKKAIYSQHPEGHFALALKDYAHFTSPIRRYADLLVHRAMKGILGLDRPFGVKDLEEVCSHISTSEQNAEKAQRDILALMRARFMAGRVGETFSGIVSGVTSFGFFVELEEYFVEGLVRLSSLFDDFYHFREKDLLLLGENTGRIIRIGDSVTVKVVRVDTSRRHIDFELAD